MNIFMHRSPMSRVCQVNQISSKTLHNRNVFDGDVIIFCLSRNKKQCNTSQDLWYDSHGRQLFECGISDFIHILVLTQLHSEVDKTCLIRYVKELMAEELGI